MRVGLIGAGNMAAAMLAGWARKDGALVSRMVLSDRGSGRAASLAERHGCTAVTDNALLVEQCDLVVLCVKPIDVETVLRRISDRVEPTTVIASVAAGVQTATIENLLDDDVPVIRFMPNVPVRVNAGTITYAQGQVRNDLSDRSLEIFGMLGHLVQLDERLFDAATAVSGSGPAFFGLFTEAVEDAAIVAGLSAAVGRQLAVTTLAGTARMLLEEDISCGDLRRMVTSPGGTAAAGLAQMERAGVRGAIIDAVIAATARARELG